MTKIAAPASLAELRKAKSLSQTALADELGIVQSRVSAIERSDIANIQIDTLRSYVAGIGGVVKLIVNLDGQDIELN